MAISKGDTGMIVAIFVGAIVASVILGSVANEVFAQTNADGRATVNQSVTAAAAGGTIDLTGRELISSIEVLDGSSADNTSTFVDVGITLQTALGSGGLLTVQALTNATTLYAGRPINVSYTYLPEGFVSNSGGRAMVELITVFAALAIVIFVIGRFMSSDSLGKLMKTS